MDVFFCDTVYFINHSWRLFSAAKTARGRVVSLWISPDSVETVWVKIGLLRAIVGAFSPRDAKLARYAGRRVSVCHKPVLYRNDWTNRAGVFCTKASFHLSYTQCNLRNVGISKNQHWKWPARGTGTVPFLVGALSFPVGLIFAPF